jgi:hypothetical protein
MLKYTKKLCIADTIIEIKSRWPLFDLSQEKTDKIAAERFNNFFYNGKSKPDIHIDLDISARLPRPKGYKLLFITHHFLTGLENWQLLRKKNSYLYSSPKDTKGQKVFINSSFSRAKAHLLPQGSTGISVERSIFVRSNNGFCWCINDIIYDFLQVLLINYFAQRNEGIFTHSVGIKDIDGSGLIFCGKSGAGKSTTARIWHSHSRATVLNDDRMIIRKNKEKFIIHGSPWHGDFSDYLVSRIEPARLKRLFFIQHSLRNRVERVSGLEAFSLLYPTLFPAFWDKKLLTNICSFAHDIVKNIPCYKMGFVDDKNLIKFTRSV